MVCPAAAEWWDWLEKLGLVGGGWAPGTAHGSSGQGPTTGHARGPGSGGERWQYQVGLWRREISGCVAGGDLRYRAKYDDKDAKTSQAVKNYMEPMRSDRNASAVSAVAIAGLSNLVVASGGVGPSELGDMQA